jgi:tellurite resistance protein
MAPLVLTAVAPLLALVQAGGGGSFGSGGGGGGGGGGDGGVVFEIVYWLLVLSIEHPVVGVPLLVGFCVLAAIGSRRGWWKHQERVIRRDRPRRQARASRDWADVLRARDAAFDEERFLARARRAFEVAQRAWCAQDLEPLRHFVSDGVFERFSLQIEEQVANGWRQGMEGLRVTGTGLVHVSAGARFDTVTVRIGFAADIHRVERASGERISGSRLPEKHFSECWSFVRHAGAESLEGDGLLEGRCPNCGATLAMNQSVKCSHCECLVKSGEFDWVLAEITQASVWRPEEEAAIPGLAAFAQRDPGLSAQLLEDRASVAFWRATAAERRGAVEPLARVATPALCEDYAGGLAPRADGTRLGTTDRAVGSVRTLGLLAGEATDRAVVEVHWDGRRTTFEADGSARADAHRGFRRTLLVFTRPAGETTPVDFTFATTHCRNCGAADDGSTRATCAYCDAPRTGDRGTWLLSALHADRSDEARALRAELAALEVAPAHALAPHREPQSSEWLLAWAVGLARADGEVSEKERRGVLSLAERCDVPRDRALAMLSEPAADDAERPQAKDAEEARAWLLALIELGLADGKLDRDERRFLQHATRELRLPHKALEHGVRATRARLFRESRDAR